MELIYQAPPITVDEIYSIGISIPEGYEADEFRLPKKKEWYLSANNRGVPLTAAGDFPQISPRIILKKKLSETPKKFRAIRVLEYTGTELFIDTTMINSHVTSAGKNCGGINNIRELSIMKEEVK